MITTKNLEYLEVARALGYSNFRIILRHILAPIIVISAANFAVAILIERDLRFLCIGTKHPTTYLGAIITTILFLENPLLVVLILIRKNQGELLCLFQFSIQNLLEKKSIK